MKPEERNINTVPSGWFDLYGDYLYSYAISRVSSRDQAQDLVQETLLAAFRTYKNFSGKSSEKTWLTTILRSKIVDYFRSRSSKMEVSWEDFASPFHEDGPVKGSWINRKSPPVWNVDAIDEIESREFMLVLSECLGQLPGNWQAVVVMKLLEENKTDLVCKELEITPSNVWVIVHRAKVQLRECLEKNWFTEPKRNEEK